MIAGRVTPARRPHGLQRLRNLVLPGLAVALLHVPVRAESEPKVDYNKHVRPILSENCFKCHGSDEKQRKGKLRLDVRDEAIAKKAIIPGKPEDSELLKRLHPTDPEDVMPPTKENRKLSDADAETLRKWIAQGAEYKKHWAFISPVKVPVPNATLPNAPEQNPIDAFVLAKLNELHLKPAGPAPKEQWLRRISFALTGLCPSLEELDAFVADNSPQAQEHVVDRLLQSPAYGEHMAKDWLDVARYADSYGRHEDGDMLVWPWRDWVIKAFNENLPYDQFITWQTAGDMLPNPTRDQLAATAFNRLALQSNESGNDPEEFRLDQVSDRVRANGLAFMGLTVECAKCHDHKYDPISTRDYWQMAAFFDNIDENGVYSQFCPAAIPSPSILLPTPEEQGKMDAIEKKIADKEAVVQKLRESLRGEFTKWVADNGVPCARKDGIWNEIKSWFGKEEYNEWRPHAKAHLDFEKASISERQMINRADKDKPAKLRTHLDLVPGPRGNTAMLMNGDDEIAIAKMGDFREYDDFSFAVWLEPREHRDRAVIICTSRGGNDDGRGFELIMENEVPSFALMHFNPGNEIRVRAKRPLPLNQWTHIAATYDGSSHASGLKIYINGELEPTEVVHDHLIKDIARLKEWGDIDQDQVRFTLGGREHDSPLKNCGVDDYWVFGRDISQGEVKALMGKVGSADEWYEWWLWSRSDAWIAAEKELEKLRMDRTEILRPVLEMMVMQELPTHRPCFVHPRGSPKQRGDAVEAGTPAAVLPFSDDLPKNRLGFAKWLTNPAHPLTARVEVNRIWQMFYGRGLVATPQDFGTRGEMPSNLELLDWLSCDFMEHHWDMKRLCRMIALSNTFAQSVQPSDPQSVAVDPDNKYLSRGPLVRLSAEAIRDQALACENLLSKTIGGPSAHPYFPANLYHDSGLQQRYDQDKGEGLYRRSVYSFWRRTLPPPELAAFDAPSREVCTLKREKTNTPLQALILLNSEQFVEAQRVIAERLLKQFPADVSARCATAFRLLTSRMPTEKETGIMVKMLASQRDHFQKNPKEATDLRANGEHPPDAALDPVEAAATAMLVRALMSHAESINR